MQPYSFQNLLHHIENTAMGARLASLSIQTKIERHVLAEIKCSGGSLEGLGFVLEEPPHRDLTVREIVENRHGPLLEWVEAKMCYSDCVARKVTGKAINKADEYARLLTADADKQRGSLLPLADRGAKLTTCIFVVHGCVGYKEHTYYPDFRNRGRIEHTKILSEAKRYCSEDITAASGREVVEHFDLQLDETTQMLCYFYRDPPAA